MRSKIYEKYNIILWTFLIGGLFGFLFENAQMILSGNFSIRQGLLHEPLIPVYGAGLLLYYFMFSNINFERKNKTLKYITIFLASFFLGGLTEYMFSFIQEKVFGTISWDYSHMTFNLNGRTSLFHSTVWGVLGLVVYLYIYPFLVKIRDSKKSSTSYVLTTIFSLFLIFDCTVSWLACERKIERHQAIAVEESMLDKVLDRYYPDERIDYIYNNAHETKK